MPFKEVDRARSVKHPKLVKKIVKELKTAMAVGGEADPSLSPIILLETTKRPPSTLHVYVIWDDAEWADVDRVERSEVIVDAMEEALPEKASLVTLALGMTSAEAKRLGIKFQ